MLYYAYGKGCACSSLKGVSLHCIIFRTAIDHACGSGVFLVDSYGRIIEEKLSENVYCEDNTILETFLIENIYSIEINEEAIDVTIFLLGKK